MNRERGFSICINLHANCSSATASNDLNQAHIDAIALQDFDSSLAMDVITNGADHRDSTSVDRRMAGKIRRSPPESFFIGKQVPQDFSQ